MYCIAVFSFNFKVGSLLDYCIVYRRSLSDNQVNESAMPHKQLTENNNPLPRLPLAT